MKPLLGRWSLCACVFFLGPGCASYGAHLSATPLKPDRDAIGLAADVVVIDRGFGAQVLPNPQLSWRHGLAEDLDLGLIANILSAEFSVRWAFVSRAGARLTAVFGLGLGLVPVTNSDVGLMQAGLSGRLLVGLTLSPNAELTLGFVSLNQLQFGFAAPASGFSNAKFVTLPGLSLGLEYEFRQFSLHPEVTVVIPYDTEREEWLPVIAQAGVVVQF